ncbi:MAG: hypothetical protein MRJ92_01615 [Nitrospira sp.]|nr:hypothetical protein [Nitrospira sp.]
MDASIAAEVEDAVAFAGSGAVGAGRRFTKDVDSRAVGNQQSAISQKNADHERQSYS